jgi:hypothetical protein
LRDPPVNTPVPGHGETMEHRRYLIKRTMKRMDFDNSIENAEGIRLATFPKIPFVSVQMQI